MFVRIASVLAFAAILSPLTVKADVAMISKDPAQISPKEASSLALKGEMISACTKVVFNTKNGRQKPVKGATVIFTKGIPKHEDAASTAMLDGKPVFKCQTKTYNLATAKFENN